MVTMFYNFYSFEIQKTSTVVFCPTLGKKNFKVCFIFFFRFHSLPRGSLLVVSDFCTSGSDGYFWQNTLKTIQEKEIPSSDFQNFFVSVEMPSNEQFIVLVPSDLKKRLKLLNLILTSRNLVISIPNLQQCSLNK